MEIIKKIFLILILITFLSFCGKKGDPEYKESNNSIIFQNILIKIS
tara:strand:- start:363 stop:500 length:138 start_codon:yes stop_codon:yes gene_type:complete